MTPAELNALLLASDTDTDAAIYRSVIHHYPVPEPGTVLSRFSGDMDLAARKVERMTAGVSDKSLPYRLLVDGEIVVHQQEKPGTKGSPSWPWAEFSYQYAGTSVFHADGERIQLAPGDCILIPRGTACSREDLDSGSILMTFILTDAFLRAFLSSRFRQPETITAFFSSEHDRSGMPFTCFPTAENRRLRVFVTEFLCLYYGEIHPRRDALENLLALILLECQESLSLPSSGTSETDPVRDNVSPRTFHAQDSRLTEMLAWICENCLTCTRASAAAHFGISETWLSTLLKKETGKSFLELVHQEKLARAASLLRFTSLSVSGIAARCGFTNLAYFHRLFQAQYGCAPGSYRETQLRLSRNLLQNSAT